jgi:Ca-activated chloride channel family protein
MKFVRYKKYVPEPASDMSMEDLLNALSDYLLQSGFQQQYMDFYDLKDAEQTLEDLRQAIADALLNSDLLDEQMREQIENMSGEQLEQLVEQLIERMEQENYINIDQPHDPARPSTAGGQVGDAQSQARFEITDKGLDFLGFKALRDLLGSLGKSSFGRHDTRDTATGIEASGASKTYEFGDQLNLDITATLSNAIQREGLHLPLNIEYNDLQVHQCEYQ